jgi:CBS domain-containing protein
VTRLRTINQVLEGKGREVWTVDPEQTVYDALTLMAEKNIGALAVMESGRLIGTISERDYARNVILKDRRSRDTKVREVMCRKVPVVSPGNSVEECMAVVTDTRVRHLPVFDGDELVGIVSIGDLVKAIIADQKFMIEQLENYITS